MLFQIYGDMAGWQLLGWVMVFVGLVVMNEIARRTKAGGIFCFFVLPAALTVYFIAIYIGAAKGADWALQNDTYVHMNSWFHYAKLYAATAGCIGFMMLKYKWGIGKKVGLRCSRLQSSLSTFLSQSVLTLSRQLRVEFQAAGGFRLKMYGSMAAGGTG